MEKDELTLFLEKIAEIESSGGKNTDHRRMTEGPHIGQKAAGKFGMMPNTIADIVRNAPGLQDVPEIKELSDRKFKYLKGELQPIENPDEVNEFIDTHPGMEELLARGLARRVKDKYGDEEAAAFAWNQGHYTPPSDITPEKLEKADYIRKFRNLQARMPATVSDKGELP